MARRAIERADALLQREERLVDLRALQPGRRIVLLCLRRALAPREIHKRDRRLRAPAPAPASRLRAQLDVDDGM